MLKIIYIYTILITLLASPQFSQQLNWQNLHAPVASSIPGITQLPNGELYLVTVTQGVFKSTDIGNSWIECNSGFSNIYLNDIYATDDSKLFMCGGSGIFQFDWQTQNWVNLNAPKADYISITISSQGHIVAGSNFGIFRSEDSGTSWIPATTYISTANSLVNINNETIYAGTSFGVYESLDNGDTWTIVGLDGKYVSDLTIDPDGNIYANVFYRGEGIYRLKNKGAIWEQLNLGLHNQLTTTVAVDVTGNIYVGTFEGGLFEMKSTQQSFSQINPHQSMSQIFKLFITQKNILFVGSEFGGLFKRSGSSTEWEQLNSGLPIAHAIPLGFDSQDNFYMGNLYSGFYRSTDTGNSWFPTAYYFGGSHRFTFLADNNQLFLGTTVEFAYWGMLLRSNDKGESWEFFQEGFPLIHPDWPWIQVVLDMDVNSNGDLIAALNTDGIYRRLVSDTSWYLINGDIPDTNIFSVCVNSNDVVFAGYRNGYIYKSTDNGEHWEESLSDIQDYTVELLRSADEYVFAILHNWNYPHQDSSLGLYSYDNGDTWSNININKLGSRVNSVEFYNNFIVVGTDTSGVFLSSDFGNNWINVSAGLSDRVIKGIVVHPGGLLLCGTENEGIYIADLNPTSVDDMNNVSMLFSLNQNYPNPFNLTTKIKYSIPHSEIIQIKVYDILGRELLTIFNEFKQPGTYEIEFDATSLSSGIYFYRIVADDFVETKKMVLMK